MLYQTYRALFMYVRPATVVVDKPCPIMTAMAAPSVLTRLAYLTFSICTFAIGDNPSGIQLPILFNSLDFFNKGSSSLIIIFLRAECLLVNWAMARQRDVSNVKAVSVLALH